ncbi:MAG: OmpA family protein [Candidatus Electrothrix sp. MAN1_4]|nr:OmpA family protein [Candidatus Electrothrix sp. MAN1_4]
MRLIYNRSSPCQDNPCTEESMLPTGKTTFFTLFLVLAVALAGCAPKSPSKQPHSRPTTLEKGISVLGRRILNSIPDRKALVLLEPFKEATLYDEIQASAEIEQILLQLGSRKNYSHIRLISIADASDKELETADYILKGVISYSALPGQPQHKYYRILASLADRKTGTLLARESTWVYSVPYGKLELPVIMADPKAKQKIIELIRKKKITVSDIKIDARIAKAKAAYRNGQYAEVRQVLEQLIASPDGGVLDAYRMLYLASLKMDDFAAAETAFFNMINIGFQNTHKMPLLFLFESNSIEFAPDRFQEYNIWIRQLNAYLKKNTTKCMHIIGHTSKQGGFQYNMELSSARAAYIKEQLIQQAPEAGIGARMTVEGKGETETKDGSEPDSDQNMIDRRVEFEMFDCSR